MFHKPASDPRLGALSHRRWGRRCDLLAAFYLVTTHCCYYGEEEGKCQVCMCVCGTRVFGKNQCMASNRVSGSGWDGMGWERGEGGIVFSLLQCAD